MQEATQRDASLTPVLPGLYPDPTICRVGEDYFIANSSMEYSPGAPIWHSTDLVEWKQIGNALQSDDQFRAGHSAASSGMYAPTLRHRDGRFFLIGTNVDDDRGGHWIVTARDPAGPWSSPVPIVGIDGIDPDIAWDESGNCLVTYCSWDAERAGIKQVTIESSTGALLDEPRWVWFGSGLSHPEGPHLYRRGSWWYLVIAEGGTERGHVVSVARAATARGPFEGSPRNPIFTHRSIRHPVQSIGHADLIERPDGSWSAVHLGVRIRGRTPRFHVNGRETFIVDIEWTDEWPSFVPFRQSLPVAGLARIDDRFESLPMHPRWVSPGLRPAELVTSAAEGISLRAGLSASGAPSGLFLRIPAEYWSARFVVSAGSARMILRLDERHWYAVRATPHRVEAVSHVGEIEHVIAYRDRSPDEPLELILAAEPTDLGGPDEIRMTFKQGGSEIHLGTLDGRYLSTEVAGGFTGRTIGLVSDSPDILVHGFTFEERSSDPSPTDQAGDPA